MYNTKQQLNNVGVVAGTLLSMIPLYYIIHYISSFGTLKKTKVFVLAIINFVSAIIGGIIAFILAFRLIFLLVEAMSYSSYYDEEDFIVDFFMTLLFIFLSGIVSYILCIVTGVVTYNFLKSNESDYLTDEERFGLAKFAGINLVYIPFYYAIKLGMEMDLIKSVDESKGGLIIAFFVLLGCSIFLGWIPFIGVLITLAFVIVTIVLAVQLNSLKDQIIAMKGRENYDNFTSF